MNQREIERWENEFDALLEEGLRLFRETPSADQVIVLKTAKENTYHIVNHNVYSGDYSDEEALIQTLVDNGDTQVLRLVCLHSLRTVGVTTWNLSQQLRRIDQRNFETEVLLHGLQRQGYYSKTLRQLLPPSKEQVI